MTMKKNLAMDGSAVLLWLPRDKTPSDKVDLRTLSEPPAEAWWRLDEALSYAMTIHRTHFNLPWIKTADQVLSPEEVSQIWQANGSKVFPDA